MPEINRNQLLAVGTTSVVASEEKQNLNSKRSCIIITNTSTNGQVITVSVDSEAVANQGVVLSVGGVWSDTKESEYYPTQKLISAIASAAGGQISIQERLGSD